MLVIRAYNWIFMNIPGFIEENVDPSLFCVEAGTMRRLHTIAPTHTTAVLLTNLLANIFVLQLSIICTYHNALKTVILKSPFISLPTLGNLCIRANSWTKKWALFKKIFRFARYKSAQFDTLVLHSYRTTSIFHEFLSRSLFPRWRFFLWCSSAPWW